MQEYVEVTGFCWLWTGSLGRYGYGRIRQAGLPSAGAHRVIYEYLVGPIQEGFELDHLCRVRNCVNPDHLEPVSTAVNVLRGFSWSGVNARKTHCPSGHEYAGDNLVVVRHGRACRTCKLAHTRKYKEKRKSDD